MAWPSVIGVAYDLASTASLGQDFEKLHSFQGSGLVMASTYSTVGQERHFYRLGVVTPIDADGDGLSAIEEVMLGTRADLLDTDGDGFDDGEEVCLYFTDPLVANNAGGTIRGRVFNDVNGDGDLADGLAINEATVYLDANYNGLLDADERTVTTDASGQYQFLAVPPGVHHIRQELVAPNIQTLPVDGIAPIDDKRPDEVTNYTHAVPGVGQFDQPYGENASDWPAEWGAIETTGTNADLVSSVDLVLKPIGVRNKVPAIQSFHGSEFLDLPTGAHITVRFDEIIIDGSGPDFLIYSISSGTTANESIEVLVGPDEANLTSLGIYSQSLATIAIDLADHGLPGPIQYVKCVSQNNDGGWWGFELVGFEAINVAPPDPATHVVCGDR